MHSQALHIDEKESSKENHYFLKAAVQQLQAADRSSTINLPSILYLCIMMIPNITTGWDLECAGSKFCKAS